MRCMDAKKKSLIFNLITVIGILGMYALFKAGGMFVADMYQNAAFGITVFSSIYFGKVAVVRFVEVLAIKEMDKKGV